MPPQLYPAEAVLPGHPDRLCDAIADALVQEATRREPQALCRIDVTVHRAMVLIAGRLAYKDAETIDGATAVRDVDIADVVKHVYTSAGYGADWGPDPSQLRVAIDLRISALTERDRHGCQAADDQAILTGYAVDLPGTNYLPAEQWLVHSLLRRLETLRLESPELRLGPDGKVIVLLEEEEYPTRLAGFSTTLQQARGGSPHGLEKAVRKVLGDELAHLSRRVPGFDARVPEAMAVNAAGAPHEGGPGHQSGQSGQRLVIDTYGPRVPCGGAALCGKDFYTAERAGTLMARRLAKAAVRTGVARECQATLAFVPGQQEAQIIALRGDGKLLDASRWAGLLDRSLANLAARYTNQTALLDVARHGHFIDEQFPWERLHFDDKT
jgi:S-adenosylmethionine synthetase